MGDIKTLKDLLAQVDYLNCETGDITDITELQQNGVPCIQKIELKVRRTIREEQDMDGKIDRALMPTKNKIEGKLRFVTNLTGLNEFKTLWDNFKVGVEQMFKDKEDKLK